MIPLRFWISGLGADPAWSMVPSAFPLRLGLEGGLRPRSHRPENLRPMSHSLPSSGFSRKNGCLPSSGSSSSTWVAACTWNHPLPRLCVWKPWRQTRPATMPTPTTPTTTTTTTTTSTTPAHPRHQIRSQRSGLSGTPAVRMNQAQAQKRTQQPPQQSQKASLAPCLLQTLVSHRIRTSFQR